MNSKLLYFTLFFLCFREIPLQGLSGPNQPILIGVEGMPGAGKTSLLTSLIDQTNCAYLLLPELNPTPQEAQELTGKLEEHIWEFYHHLWVERLSITQNSSLDELILFDRTYFTNLAFTFAQGQSQTDYLLRKTLVKKEFSSFSFDLMIILDVSPKEGLRRRLENRDSPPYPWSELSFLEKLRRFYYEELPNIYAGPILYISTECMSKDEVRQTIQHHLIKSFKDRVVHRPQSTITDLDRRIILNYARKKQLGQAYTQGTNVLGYPTIYFRQHAIQLHSNQLFFLNNSRLRQIIQSRNSVRI